MARKNIVKGKIANALESVAPDHILGVSNDIFDEGLQMYQGGINRSSLVFDISVHKAVDGVPTAFADLAAALGPDGENVPKEVRQPGMRVQFIQVNVQSFDHKYVQYRYIRTSTDNADFTNPDNWQGVDDEPTAGSKNLVESGGVNTAIGAYFYPKEVELVEELSKARFDNNNNIVVANVPKLVIKYIHVTLSGYYLIVIHNVKTEPSSTMMGYVNKIGIFNNIPAVGETASSFIEGEKPSIGKTIVSRIHVETGQYLAICNHLDYGNVSFFSNADDITTIEKQLSYSLNPISAGAVKVAIDELNTHVDNTDEQVESLKSQLSIIDAEEISFEKIIKLRVDIDSNIFIVSGSIYFKIAYAFIPEDTQYENIIIDNIDNYNHAYLQVIGVSSGIPSADMEYTQLDYFRFTGSETNYSKKLSITDDIKGNYLFVSIFDNPSTNPTSLSITGIKHYDVISKMEEDIENLDERVEAIESSNIVLVPKIYNPSINFQKQELRVLDIGNSFTNGAITYLANLITSAGIDISNIAHCVAYRGGASFKNWYDCYHDADTEPYTITKRFGGLSVDLTGTAGRGNGEKFRNVLTNNTFDIIVIHQASVYSDKYSEWEGNGNGGYLKEFIRLIRTKQPQASIGYLFTHSNPEGNPDVNAFYDGIASSVKNISKFYGIDFVIPYGTAIQNIRQSVINTSTHYLTKDGKHIAPGLAQYVASCTYFQSLISPRYGVSVYGNNYIHTVTESEKNGIDTEYLNDCIDVTSENASIAQMAATIACNDFYSVQNPDGVTL